jgi:hypothetical protein
VDEADARRRDAVSAEMVGVDESGGMMPIVRNSAAVRQSGALLLTIDMRALLR